MKLSNWEKKHEEQISRLITKIEALYSTAIKESAKIGVSVPNFNPDKIFNNTTYPSIIKKLDKIAKDLANNIQVVIENGLEEQWEMANAKNDEMCHLAFGGRVDAMTGKQLSKFFNNNTEALSAFRGRKVAGMGLSQRVWKLTSQFKEQIEMAIDLGLRDGVSAAKMSTTLKQYLNEPNRLFRRVRDEHGALHLSKSAKSYRPGQGIYRSSHKNAMRLARTEVNMAYRTSDHLRIQDLDFVVGIEVHRSNHIFACSVCEALAGKYPKDFKFVGWHPQCRCYTTTILKEEAEMEADNERILRGEAPSTTSKNSVTTTPKGFNTWVKDNADRIKETGGKSTSAYFVNDNKKYIDDIIKASK